MKKKATVFLLLFISLCSYCAASNAIAFLLDISKSIPEKDFEKAKEQIQTIASQDTSSAISVYTFGSELNKIEIGDLPGIKPTESYTMLYDAVYDVAQTLAKTESDKKAIFIVSDGDDTRSVTVLEDAVTFANNNGIAVYGVGLGKVNRKSLERIAKLTGGEFFSIKSDDLPGRIQSGLQMQKSVQKKEAVAPAPVTSPPAPVAQTQPPATKPPAVEIRHTMPYLWIGGGIAGILLLSLVVLLVVRSFRDEKHICPTCGKVLESYQTVCPVCASADTRRERIPMDGTQEIKTHIIETAEDLIPVELLEKKPVTEEMLSRTFVLMETPVLVVRKGKNLGQAFSLNRAFPVSIGRSRVNEIRLDDASISGQHCRIIPEDGKHVLYDMESTNGTFVNDKRVKKATLKEGDTIRVGETQFLYKIEQHRN